MVQIPQQGWSQQTPAAMAIIKSGYGALTRRRSSSTKRKRSSKAMTRKTSNARAGQSKKRVAGSARRSSASSTRRASLVKGSAAAKAWGRKMKALRKRRA